jgi:hypothetical protein
MNFIIPARWVESWVRKLVVVFLLRGMGGRSVDMADFV